MLSACAPSLPGSLLPSREPDTTHRESVMDERAYLHKPELTSAQARGIPLLCVLHSGWTSWDRSDTPVESICLTTSNPGSGLSPEGKVGVKETAEEAIDRQKERFFSP